jgi:hypothetical protein
VEFNFLPFQYVRYCYVKSQFFVITIIVLLIISKVYLNLLTICKIIFISRCMFVIPETNIGGGAGSSLSCLVLLPVSACRRASNIFSDG